jgi:hypothetical protein
VCDRGIKLLDGRPMSADRGRRLALDRELETAFIESIQERRCPAAKSGGSGIHCSSAREIVPGCCGPLHVVGFILAPCCPLGC